MRNPLLFVFIITSLFFSCIGDDIIDDRVDEVVAIANPIDTLQIGDTYTFEANYFDNIGRQQNATVVWESTDETVMSITSSGTAEGIKEGIAYVSASVEGIEGTISSTAKIIVSQNETSVQTNVRNGKIRTTSSYALEGDFTLEKEGNNLKLTLLSNFRTTDALPGLYVYLGNNPSSIASAKEIGPITQFSGQHSYTIQNVGIFQYQYVLFWCKPFGVKVGEGTFNE
jgi:proline dehydrogenase